MRDRFHHTPSLNILFNVYTLTSINHLVTVSLALTYFNILAGEEFLANVGLEVKGLWICIIAQATERIDRANLYCIYTSRSYIITIDTYTTSK